MIYLGLDLGSKTLGLSISDKTSTIASSLKVIIYNSEEELFMELSKIVEDYKVDAFVLGNPKNLDGSLSKRSEITLKFKEKLEKKYNKEVILQDERLSTVEAERVLIGSHIRRNNRKKVIDSMAAVIILQTFLDKGSGKYEYNYN